MSIQHSPVASKTGEKMSATLNVSPVKVPNGAKHVGNYILGKSIGNGSFGKVHLGLHIQSGQKVAIKIIEKQKLNSKDLQRIHREIQILKFICHPSIVQLYQILQTEKSLLFITEFMPNGELFNYIVQNKKLHEKQACLIFHQIINAIQYLHNMGVAHRDLKPENMMIEYDKKIKIIDFGLANKYQSETGLKTQCGSPCYAAPEMISGKSHYDPLKTDIWSCGVTLFAMIAGYLPFCQKQTSKLFKKIVTGNFQFPNWVSQGARQLISSILNISPSKRFTLQQIKDHPWFNQVTLPKSVGVDTRFFKMPAENFIVEHIITSKLGTDKLWEKIEKNEKTKQTTLYYLIAKKLTREGHILKSYFGSPYFDPSFLKPILDDDSSSSTYACVQVQAVSPITDTQALLPKTSCLPSFNLKSASFKPILIDFLSPEPESMSEIKKMIGKEQFYCYNSDNWKKRTKLTAKTTKQRAQTLFHIRKKNPMNNSLLKSLKTETKKNAIDILQNLNSSALVQTIPKRKTLNLRKKPINPHSFWEEDKSGQMFF